MTTKTILIVEDDVSVVVSYMQVLETLGLDFIPMVASNYKSAREILSTEDIDLIILDLVLPDVLATEIVDQLRYEHPGTPIFIITGYPDQWNRTKPNGAGITNFFAKPFHVETLAQAIESSLYN